MARGTIIVDGETERVIAQLVERVHFELKGHPLDLEAFDDYRTATPDPKDLIALCNALLAGGDARALSIIREAHCDLLQERSHSPRPPNEPAQPPKTSDYWLSVRLKAMSATTLAATALGLLLIGSAVTLLLTRDSRETVHLGRNSDDPPRTFISSQGRDELNLVGTLWHAEGSDPPRYSIQTGRSDNINLSCVANGAEGEITAHVTCEARRKFKTSKPSLIFDLRRGKLVTPSPDLAVGEYPDPPQDKSHTGAPAARWRDTTPEVVGNLLHVPATEPPEYVILLIGRSNVVQHCSATGRPTHDAHATMTCKPWRINPALPAGLAFDLKRGVQGRLPDDLPAAPATIQDFLLKAGDVTRYHGFVVGDDPPHQEGVQRRP